MPLNSLSLIRGSTDEDDNDDIMIIMIKNNDEDDDDRGSDSGYGNSSLRKVKRKQNCWVLLSRGVLVVYYEKYLFDWSSFGLMRLGGV